MANILEPTKNTKNLKSLLTNLLHRGPLKTTSGAACGPRVGQPLPTWNLKECKCDATTPVPLTLPIEYRPVGGRASGVVYTDIQKWQFWGW